MRVSLRAGNRAKLPTGSNKGRRWKGIWDSLRGGLSRCLRSVYGPRIIVEYNDVTGLRSRRLYGPSCDVVSSVRNKERRRFRYKGEDTEKETRRERERETWIFYFCPTMRRKRLLRSYTRIVNRGMITMRLTVPFINSNNEHIRHKSIDTQSN